MSDARLLEQKFASTVKIGGKRKRIVLTNYKLPTETENFQQIHHIHILDRSGSMSSVIGQLMDNVKQVVATMGTHDLLSIIWFSGEGQAKVLLRGAGKYDQQHVDTLLDSIKSTIGCTCFSEPLALANEIIDDLASLCPNFNVNLFTDGEPVVYGSTAAEIEKIFNELDKMKAKIIAFNTIGYTRYADQQLLTRMSDTSSHGRYIFSNDIKDYNEIFANNYKRIQGLSGNVFSDKGDCEFYYKDNNTIAFGKNSISLPTSNQFSVFTVGRSENGNYQEIADSDLQDILYQIAYEAYYRGNSEYAYDCIACLGDKHLATVISGAFSSEERANATKELLEAVKNRSARFIDGRTTDLEVSNTMFCVFDLLRMLRDCKFIPNKEYKRIGVKVIDTENIFSANPDQTNDCTFGDNLVFASDKANVSVRYVIEGKVKILATAAKRVGLPGEVDSKIYRMQTIIKDGQLNTDNLSAIVDFNTLEKIRKKCSYYGINYKKFLVEKTTIQPQTFQVTFDLTALPIINRKGVNLSIETIAQFVARSNQLKAQQKILNSYLKGADLINAPGQAYNEQQLAVLADHGIKYGIYNGINKIKDPEAAENLDYYTVKSLEFQQKGWSSIPAVQSSIAKGGKPGTPGQYIKDCAESDDFVKAEKDLAYARCILKNVKEELLDISTVLSIIRLYKSVTGGFWEGLNLVAENKYEYASTEDPANILVIKTNYEQVPYTPDQAD